MLWLEVIANPCEISVAKYVDSTTKFLKFNGQV